MKYERWMKGKDWKSITRIYDKLLVDVRKTGDDEKIMNVVNNYLYSAEFIRVVCKYYEEKFSREKSSNVA